MKYVIYYLILTGILSSTENKANCNRYKDCDEIYF